MGGGGPAPPDTPVELLVYQTKRAKTMLRDPLKVSVNDNCRKL